MRFAADFHIHSKYSRATSKDMNLEELDRWARIKGVGILGTGDFTHPEWFSQLKSQLEPAEPGLFKLRSCDSPTRFVLTAEISCIYSKKDRVRKIHLLILSPSFEAAEKINAQLGWIGNLRSDGRPILGLDAKEALKISLAASEDCMVVPCHAWTPWFSIFGSRSGFDSIEEGFDEYSKHIYAIETGLSSDPAMNWRLSALDTITLLSNSDSHSAPRIGREANIFDTEVSYYAITKAIKEKNPEQFLYTVEFFPEEGKYHYDGHRLCNVSLAPAESKERNAICPKCNKPLTVGVLNRVEALADRPPGFKPRGAIAFKSLVPLEEIIADALGVGVGTKQAERAYDSLIKAFNTEFNILLEVSAGDLRLATDPRIAQGIVLVREGRVAITPGYDGVYGKIKIFGEDAGREVTTQKAMF